MAHTPSVGPKADSVDQLPKIQPSTNITRSKTKILALAILVGSVTGGATYAVARYVAITAFRASIMYAGLAGGLAFLVTLAIGLLRKPAQNNVKADLPPQSGKDAPKDAPSSTTAPATKKPTNAQDTVDADKKPAATSATKSTDVVDPAKIDADKKLAADEEAKKTRAAAEKQAQVEADKKLKEAEKQAQAEADKKLKDAEKQAQAEADKKLKDAEKQAQAEADKKLKDAEKQAQAEADKKLKEAEEDAKAKAAANTPAAKRTKAGELTAQNHALAAFVKLMNESKDTSDFNGKSTTQFTPKDKETLTNFVNAVKDTKNPKEGIRDFNHIRKDLNTFIQDSATYAILLGKIQNKVGNNDIAATKLIADANALVAPSSATAAPQSPTPAPASAPAPVQKVEVAQDDPARLTVKQKMEEQERIRLKQDALAVAGKNRDDRLNQRPGKKVDAPTTTGASATGSAASPTLIGKTGTPLRAVSPAPAETPAPAAQPPVVVDATMPATSAAAPRDKSPAPLAETSVPAAKPAVVADATPRDKSPAPLAETSVPAAVSTAAPAATTTARTASPAPTETPAPAAANPAVVADAASVTPAAIATVSTDAPVEKEKAA